MGIEEQLASLKKQQQKHQEKISIDTERPTLTVTSADTVEKRGVIKDYVKDNVGIAEVASMVL